MSRGQCDSEENRWHYPALDQGPHMNGWPEEFHGSEGKEQLQSGVPESNRGSAPTAELQSPFRCYRYIRIHYRLVSRCREFIKSALVGARILLARAHRPHTHDYRRSLAREI